MACQTTEPTNFEYLRIESMEHMANNNETIPNKNGISTLAHRHVV